MDIGNRCPTCEEYEESQEHVLGSCRYAAEVWQNCSLNIQPPDGSSNFKAWFFELANTKRDEDVAKAASILYAVWDAKVHGSASRPGFLVAQLVKREWNQHKKTEVPSASHQQQRPEPEHNRWKAPSPGSFKINVDAALRTPGTVSVGMIVRNHMGGVEVAAGSIFELHATPIVGEALAVRCGLDLARARGMDSFTVESDCRQL
ncbi:hypothetical protein Droror1_Dr00014140 [Drosera rotundifolia]